MLISRLEPEHDFIGVLNDANMGPNWSVWLDGVDHASNPDDDGAANVPEPGTLGLLGLGLVGLGLRCSRKA